MAYQVLARKYRPQSFEEIVGQEHVATTLKNALKQSKIAHAYLFSGPRGVGKTTTARILAKCLNCEKGPTPEPCNQCDACLRIAQGQELVDVLEIDAASNRGIEEIRELRENVRYAPAKSRYKVYIVDEAHQITHDAFNAFLKTLEEPPEHAVFVLATTEMQKIPATILSRCQSFRFRRVSPEDISGQLSKILAQEKLKVDSAALLRLAKAAGGSVRDALSLLDQSLAYSTGTLTLPQVEALLGFLPEESLQGFAQALLSHDPSTVLQRIKALSDEGWELTQFVLDFRDYVRDQMSSQIGAGKAPEQLTLGGSAASLPQILQILKVMGQCADEMRWNDNPQIVLEMYGLRLTQPLVDIGELLRRLEALEKGEPIEAASRTSGVSGALPTLPSPRQVVIPGPAASMSTHSPFKPSLPPAAATFQSKAPEKENVSPSGSAPRPSADVATLWKQFLNELWKKPGVASHFERARLKTATENEWVISFADKFAMDATQRSQAFVQETLDKLAGRRVMLRYIQEARAADQEDTTVVVNPEADQKLADANKDANVQKILKMFKGKVRLPDEPETQ